MTDLSSLITRDESPLLKMRQAVVQSIQTGTLTIRIGGSTNDVAGVKFLTSYGPIVGDVVWVAQQGNDLIVIGMLDPSTLPVPHSSAVGTGSLTAASTGSTSYVDMIGGAPTIPSFVKVLAGTKLEIDLSFQYFQSAGGGTDNALLATVSVNNVDQGDVRFFTNELSSHKQFHHMFEVTGVAAGTFAVKGRIKVASTNPVVNCDTNDHFSLRCTETF